MENDPFENLDDFLESSDFAPESTEILIMGDPQLFNQIAKSVDNNIFTLFHVENINSVAKLLLEHYFSIIVLDNTIDTDLITVSKRLRENHALARIVIAYENQEIDKYVKLLNTNSVDAFLPIDQGPQIITTILMEQDAKYTIQKGVTEFVSEPPELSKASFLLLDPTLSFGDEDQPLNFVGVMIVVDGVPRYNVFFEETLRKDEVLFAAFLSSISSMGDELFQSEKSLKEINFGGISVIFRFDDDIQFAFLVKNLTRQNYLNAEERIDDILNIILNSYKSDLMKITISQDILTELNQLFYEFDETDIEEEETYKRMQEEEAIREFGVQNVLILAQETQEINLMKQEIVKFHLERNLVYDLVSASDEEDAYNVIKERNVGVILLDSSFFAGKSGIFILESIKELDPSIQIILLSNQNKSSNDLIEILNSNHIDYFHSKNDKLNSICKSIRFGLDESLHIKSQKSKGIVQGKYSKGGINIAKAMLKDNLEAFDTEIRPELMGIVISKQLNPIFKQFWEVNGNLIDFDVEMMTGLVTGLKNISGEIFEEQESIDGFEVAGHEVFVRFNSEFMFLYFIDQVTPTTSVLISKEIDAITQLYAEIISKSIGVLSATQLKPIFTEIANSARDGLTKLLRESTRRRTS